MHSEKTTQCNIWAPVWHKVLQVLFSFQINWSCRSSMVLMSVTKNTVETLPCQRKKLYLIIYIFVSASMNPYEIGMKQMEKKQKRNKQVTTQCIFHRVAATDRLVIGYQMPPPWLRIPHISIPPKKQIDKHFNNRADYVQGCFFMFLKKMRRGKGFAIVSLHLGWIHLTGGYHARSTKQTNVYCKANTDRKKWLCCAWQVCFWGCFWTGFPTFGVGQIPTRKDRSIFNNKNLAKQAWLPFWGHLML